MEEHPLCAHIRELREKKGLGLREVARLSASNPVCGKSISPAYLSQVEKGSEQVRPDKISFDFFWSLGVVLEADPVEMFIISRPNIPQTLRDPKRRAFLFGTKE